MVISLVFCEVRLSFDWVERLMFSIVSQRDAIVFHFLLELLILDAVFDVKTCANCEKGSTSAIQKESHSWKMFITVRFGGKKHFSHVRVRGFLKALIVALNTMLEMKAYYSLLQTVKNQSLTQTVAQTYYLKTSRGDVTVLKMVNSSELFLTLFQCSSITICVLIIA